MRWYEDTGQFSSYSEEMIDAGATLNSVHPFQRVFRALKHFSLAGHPWLSMWYLEMKLQRRRFVDPALSWADRCEGPSMR